MVPAERIGRLEQIGMPRRFEAVSTYDLAVVVNAAAPSEGAARKVEAVECELG